jgi:hypothetical protein
LRLVTNVLRTIDKVGGLDSYLTCTTRSRMRELGPRGWEIRAAVVEKLREKERVKYMRILQRSILLCPELRMDTEWSDIRPLIKHTEGYAVLPERHCKRAFTLLMERLREGRPVMPTKYKPETIVLPPGLDSDFVREVKLLNSSKHTNQRFFPKVFRRRARLLRRASKYMTPTASTTANDQRIEEGKKKGVKKSSKQKRIERRARAKEARIKASKKRKAQLS